MSIWEEVEAEYACAHEHREVRYSVAANGVRQYREQCTACGDLSQFLKHSDRRVMSMGVPVEVDFALTEAYRQMVRMEAQRRITEENVRQMMARLQERDEEETRWWAEYNQYLQSGDWQARRRMVLERDGYLCQSCRMNKASQAHHLTYDHGFDAPLFDLIAVCVSCHERITTLDRERRQRRYRSVA